MNTVPSIIGCIWEHAGVVTLTNNFFGNIIKESGVAIATMMFFKFFGGKISDQAYLTNCKLWDKPPSPHMHHELALCTSIS